VQILWRLRSPFSDQVGECHLIERSPTVYELRVVVHDGHQTAPESTSYSSVDGAMQTAAILAGALRADGWSDASEDEQPA
jgi:hypothetical protein